jgi:hypothetical protein
MTPGSLLDGISSGQDSDSETAIKAMFPTSDPYKMLQMITEHSPRSVGLVSVLGVMRRRFNSTVLRMYQEELNLNKIAQDRKGRIELSEVIVGTQRKASESYLP